MNRRSGLRCGARWLALLLAATAAGRADSGVRTLRLIGVASLPAGTRCDGERVGGLSGLDYDAAHDQWLAVSDDKGEFGPARCFVIRLAYDAAAVGAVAVTGVIRLQPAGGDPNGGAPVPGGRVQGEVPDLESIRIDSRDGSLWVASEGEAKWGHRPVVRQLERDGRHRRDLPLPSVLAHDPSRRTGPRPNLSFEGLAFCPAGDAVWLALEAPLWQDGDVAGAGKGAVVRLTCLERDGRMRRQVAYRLEPRPLVPAPRRLADNGVAEVLAVSDRELLVLERGGAQQADGTWRFAARLFLASVASASEVGGMAALPAASFTPASKRLLLELGTAAGERVDNLEGLAWGRVLPNGRRSLVLVSDDNFSVSQQTQFWVFEVQP